MTHWKEAFDPGKARMDDEFWHKLIEMYRARAKLYQMLSWALLVLTAAIIVAGILMFVRGDPQEDVLAESEVELHKQIGTIQRQIDDLGSQSAQAVEGVVTAQRAEVLATILTRTKNGVVAFRSDPTPALRDSVLRVLNVSRNIASAVAKEPLSATTIVVSGIQPGDSNSFSLSALQILKQSVVETSIDIDQLNKELSQLIEQFEALQQKASPPGMSFSNEELAPLNAVIANHSQWLRLDEVRVRIADILSKARLASQRDEEQKTIVETKRQTLAKEKADLDQKLTSVRQQREKILFMAWVPGLTLRVGAIVMLLFLTQILLATYRYAAGISAFYLARSDAIQLMQAHPDNPRRYVIEQLQALMDVLTPSRYQIDAVKDPAEHVTELAKAWVQRK